MFLCDLSGNMMKSEGVRHLLPCLAQLPKLSRLCIYREFQICDLFVCVLVAIVYGIVKLEFAGNDVDDETKQQVQSQLSHMNVLHV